MSNLPKGWNVLALNQICDLQNGYAFKSNDYVNISNTLNCRMSNIRPNGFFDLEHNQKFLPDSYTQKYKQYLLKDGDVIIAMTDMATEAKILGVPTIVETQGKNLLLNQRVGKLIIKKPELIYFPYLRYVLNREQVKKYFLKFAGGGLQINLGKDDILSVEIPLPSLEEQKRIAEILDRAQSLISKRREAIGQLDTLTQAIFIEMFGDVVKNQKNWKTDRMENLMRIRRGGSPRPIEKYLGGDINWIKIGDGTKGSDIYLESCDVKITRDGLSKTVFLKKGSLIFANCGVSLGFARILKIDGCIHDGWLSFDDIDEIKLDKLFLLKAINSITNHFRAIAPDGTQPNLNTGLMKNFLMILPPLPLQQEFAQRVEAVEKLKASHRASLSELDALFASLQHRAFRGEL